VEHVRTHLFEAFGPSASVVVIRCLASGLTCREAGRRCRVFCTIDEERRVVQIDHVARLP
jgi:hypothetical protein